MAQATEKAEKRKKKQNNDETEKKKSNNKRKVTFTNDTIDNEVAPKPKKRSQLLQLTSAELSDELKKPENRKNIVSKRQKKKAKHVQLQEETKQKTELKTQQAALNYLSKWKHDRNSWKFEKLRQVWLRNHLFDSARLPNEFWTIAVEYFGGAKGKIRVDLNEECVKIIEAIEEESETIDDDRKQLNDDKIERARTLLQFLQE